MVQGSRLDRKPIRSGIRYWSKVRDPSLPTGNSGQIKTYQWILCLETKSWDAFLVVKYAGMIFRRLAFNASAPSNHLSTTRKPSLGNIILGATTFLLAFSLLFIYHSHISADKIENENLLNKLTAIRKTLSRSDLSDQLGRHAGSNAVQNALRITGPLPLLEDTIAKLADRASSVTSMQQDNGGNNSEQQFISKGHDSNQDASIKQKRNDKITNIEITKNNQKELEGLPIKSSSISPNLRGHELSSNDVRKNEDVPTLKKASNEPFIAQDKTLSSGIGAAALGQDTVLLIIASAGRPQYLQRCLAKVIQFHPLGSAAILVSEDGNSPEVARVVQEARENLHQRHKEANVQWNTPLQHVHHIATAQERGENGYFALSAHFKYALQEAFNHPPLYIESVTSAPPPASPSINRVIILEEDLEIANDFYEYFGALSSLLDRDMQLLCVSAWNDNGQRQLVRDPQALMRSDFFPGLGWMLSRRIYEELITKWPRAYWDDWLREPPQRKGRHCIHPEISRTFHYGKMGVSASQYQNQYLDHIQLNTQYVPFGTLDLSYLEEKQWEDTYLTQVRNAEQVSREQFDQLVPNRQRLELPLQHQAGQTTPGNSKASPIHPIKEYKVEYIGNRGFESVAHWAGVMDNIKANVPRTAYKGIVSLWVGEVKLHLVPRGI